MMFVGATRFSLYVPNSGAWLASNGTKVDPQEYREFLFDEERMAPRCDIFVNHTVPMLDLAARGHQVRHVVYFSDIMPERYKVRLREAAERSRVLVLREVPVGADDPEWFLRRLGQELSRELGVEGRPYGQYRLDDDDVLSADYFDQMAPYITEHHVGWVVTLAKGITAIYHDGAFHMAREAILPLHSKGHLDVVQWVGDELRCPVLSSHITSDQYNPVVLDSRRPSHLWVRSVGQDGALHQQGMDPHEMVVRMQNALNRLERVSPRQLDEVFPLMRGRIHTGRVPGF